MVNTVSCYKSMLHNVMKLAGMKPIEVEIEPGTSIHFWVPSKKKDKKKPDVVLIHGFAGDGILTWQFQILSLRKKYNLYVPDIIFFGKSHTDRIDRTTRSQADCLATGLRKLGLEEKCIVVGFSYGGFVGFQLAEHYPNLVGSMVIYGSVLGLSESISIKAFERIGFSSWAGYLMPNSVEGVKILLDVGSFNLPKTPKFFYKHCLQVRKRYIRSYTFKSRKRTRKLEFRRKMVNTVSCYKSILHNVMKLAGMRTKEVEIEPGTTMHFWVPRKHNIKKPNIVLVHGFQADGILTWQFQVLSLRKKYNVYVPDLLFFGKSYTSRSERTTRFQADCLAIGLDKLGLAKNCIYVGFSYGGMVGSQLAEHHPEWVGLMVITDSVLAETESISRKALARIGFSNWPDCLMPTTVEGVKILVDVSSNKKNFPWMPNFFFKDYLKHFVVGSVGKILKSVRRMVNIVSCYRSMLHNVMKLAGMKSIEVEIEPGTIMHFWVPSKENDRKPKVVLVHGFAGDGILTWQFQVLALGKKYKFYVPDLLFFGKSHTSKCERTTKFQAECLAKGLKILGLVKNCIVVGFSYGGMVSFQLAEHHPEMVGSMIITGSVLAETESISSKSLAQIGFTSWPNYLIPNTLEGVKVLLDYCSYKNNFPRMPNCFYQHYLEVMFGNRKERVELLEALVIKDEDVTKHQFQQPIHLIWGNQDKIFDMEVATNLKERLGGKTKLLVVEDAGHLALLERPCVFNRRLKELLGTLATDGNNGTTA